MEVDDHPHRIAVTTLGDLFLTAADRYPGNDAIVFPDARVSYRELTGQAYARARSLLASGIGRGDHVGILMPNCIDYVACLMGIAFVGAVAVTLNARYKPRELAYVIENADLTALLTNDLIAEHADFATLLHEALPGLAAAAAPARLELEAAPRLRYVAMFGPSTPAGMVPVDRFESWAAERTDADVDARRVGVQVGDPVIMMYTSGTTSTPKGCPLDHESLVRNGINMNRERYFLDASDRFWAPLPMFHMASILPLMCCFDAAATLLSMTHFDAGAALQMLESERATVAFPAFPTVTNELINHPDFARRDLTRLRRINNVAPVEVLRRFQSAFPQAVQTGAYGLTEAGGVIAFNHPDETLEQRLTTCGRAFPGIEIAIIDPESEQHLAPGVQGEMLIRGYAVFGGYYKAPEKNAEAFLDGWFRTGDLCSVDEHGYIRFHGRLKDMLKVGGENVAALEIESLLATHPAVKLAQVIGVPDERLLEVPAAFVELNAGADATASMLVDYCRERIASFKVPRYVRFVTEWPMSATKVQKFRLREWFDGQAQQLDHP